MIKKIADISLIRGGKFFRLFLFVFICTQAHAQIDVHYTCNNLNINTYGKTIQGKVRIDITNASEDRIDSLLFVYWPAAYKPVGTFLANEMLEDQNAKLRFAKLEQLGLSGLTYSFTETVQTHAEVVSDEQFIVNMELLPGETKPLFISFISQLPSSEFNGYGQDENTIRLSHFVPEIVPNDSTGLVALNSRNRESWTYPATYDLRLSVTEEAELLTNISINSGDSKKWHLTANVPVRDVLILLAPEVTHFTVPGTVPNVELHFGLEFPAFNQVSSWDNVTTFMKRELGWEPKNDIHIAFFGKGGLQSSGNLILMNPEFKQDEVEASLVEEIVSVIARAELNINPAKHPWMVEGLANYYKHLYYEQYYPNKKLLGPFANTYVARLFDIDHYPIKYQNRMLFLYMTRQGLDQPLSDHAFAYPRANREAIIKGKSSMIYAYARSYVGDKNFRRSMLRWFESNNRETEPQDWIDNLNYFHNQDANWLLGELYSTSKKLDYSLKRTENCTYVYTATVKNKGQLTTPYSITGIKDTNEVLTQWFEGHDGKKTVQIHLEDYEKVKIDVDEAMPEFSQKNNLVKTHGLFKRMKPLKLQFYTSFENPEKTQIFWLPSVKYNAYDQFLLGAQFYNSTLFRKPFEYRIAPDYSTGTGSLTGMASLRYNWTPTSSPFHLISLALYSRYYHYDRDLAYFRLSPTLTFNIRKSHPRSEWIRTIRLRSVSVDKEVPTNPEDFTDVHANANYQIFDLRYKAEKGSLLSPFIGMIDLQASENFFKASIDIKQRWRFAKNYLLTARLFAGTSSFKSGLENPEFYQYGLSGTQDYLFDYYFLGRSDISGIWSQQMFVTDGGFKSETNTFGEHMFAANLNLPFFRYFGAFGDVGYVINPETDAFFWDYGIYVEFIPDFVEVYFPFQSNLVNHIAEPEYYKSIRFVLNLDFDAIVNRVRRGLY